MMQPKASTAERALQYAAILGVLLLMGLALFVAPSFVGREGFTAPLTWKLFFFHVPAAIVSFIAFAVALVGSLQYLRTKQRIWDHRALAGVEVGVVLTVITLATGMLWGRAEWGLAWSWGEAKLVVELVLFLVYAAYLLLRREIHNPETRRRVAAVYASAGFLTVPLVYWAQDIWAQYRHPVVFGPQGGGLQTPGVEPIFLTGVLVFLLVTVTLIRWRVRLLMLAERLEAAK
jgi:heme exporter protein C